MIHQDIKILVVDDDPDVLFATSRVVTSAGYTVMEASTGEAAIKTAMVNLPKKFCRRHQKILRS